MGPARRMPFRRVAVLVGGLADEAQRATGREASDRAEPEPRDAATGSALAIRSSPGPEPGAASASDQNRKDRLCASKTTH
jgi:hypothetical protein